MMCEEKICPLILKDYKEPVLYGCSSFYEKEMVNQCRPIFVDLKSSLTHFGSFAQTIVFLLSGHNVRTREV